MRRIIVVLGVMLLLGVIVAHAQDNAPLTETQISVFAPYSSRGLSPTLTVTETFEGASCQESFASRSRPDAWRCFTADSLIYDPCFADFGLAEQVACPGLNVASGEVMVLNLSAPLEVDLSAQSTFDVDSAAPWLLELEDGRRCFLASGATGGIAAMHVAYECDIDSSLLVGGIERDEPVWRIFNLKINAYTLEYARIARAWF
jgi:hypothetical protein